MIFRQLFEPESSSYTYLLACPDSRSALLIDPVLETVERDLAVLQALGLGLAWTLDTHIHADHVTGADRLRSLTSCRAASPPGVAGACRIVSEIEPLEAGCVTVRALFTPGHSEEHHSYLVEAAGTARVFTGDLLLIGGCGRTDLQGGDPAALYRSVHDRIFTLPDDTIVCPGHDYRGLETSTVGAERSGNARLGGGRTAAEFAAIMAALDLPRPKRIDSAVPANRLCGRLPGTDSPA
ncbi:MAG TPA: MBL fold metallo-hydrolase [Allosphingosinicella sp.]|nr:MBL fold metallo-hydrolase [Allosphingosinicella sp.]